MARFMGTIFKEVPLISLMARYGTSFFAGESPQQFGVIGEVQGVYSYNEFTRSEHSSSSTSKFTTQVKGPEPMSTSMGSEAFLPSTLRVVASV
jgi:hypothetical protein